MRILKILAIDLGKFNCVSFLFDIANTSTEFETFKTYRIEFERLLNRRLRRKSSFKDKRFLSISSS